MNFRRWVCALVSVGAFAIPGFAKASWWSNLPFQPAMYIYQCRPTDPKDAGDKTSFVLYYSYFGSVINFVDAQGLMPKTAVSARHGQPLTQAETSALNLPPGRYLSFTLAKQDSGGSFEESNHCLSANVLNAAKVVTMGSGFTLTNRPRENSSFAISLIWECSRQ